MVSHPSSRRGFSRVDEQRPQPASTHPGRLPRQPSLGKGAEGGRAQGPLRSGGTGEGMGAQISERGLGTPGAGCEGKRAAGSWFPRSPRAPHSVSLQVSTQFCQHRGACPTPSSACQRHWWLRREAQSQGTVGRKEWPERVYEDPALPAHCALYQAATAGGASTPRPAPRKFAPGAPRLPKPRTRDTTPSSLRAAGHRPRNLDGGEQMSYGN